MLAIRLPHLRRHDLRLNHAIIGFNRVTMKLTWDFHDTR